MMRLLPADKAMLRYLISGIIIIFVIIWLIMLTLSNLRKEAIQTHKNIANLHAYTFEEHFSQILQHISHTIDRVPLLSNDVVSHEQLSPIFIELLENAPYLRSLSLVDSQGKIIASSNEPSVTSTITLKNFLPIPFSDKPMLRIGVPWEGRDFDEARPSDPNQPIASNKITFLPLMKKVLFSQKSYYIIANLNSDYLLNRYSTILPHDQGTISLWRNDGILLFSTDSTLLLGSAYASAPNIDFYENLVKNMKNPIDISRLAPLFPFIITIQTNEKYALEYWDKERNKVLWISTLLISLLGVLSYALIIRYYQENERQKNQLAYEKQFRLAMEATQTGLWTYNLQTKEMTWDPQCYLLLGYEPYTFDPSHEKILELTHPDESTVMDTWIKEQIIAHGGFIIERRMKTNQNEWVWIQVRGKVVEYTLENEPLILMGVYINIDTQKRAEQLHLFAVAFETQEAILITDANEKILKVNEAFTRITGYSEEEIIGQTPRILSSHQHDDVFYTTMWKSLQEKGFWQGEMWNQRKNGEVYAEYLTITAIKDTFGITSHYLANFSDITPHKVAQKQMQEMAYYDPLTHLANRRLLDEIFAKALFQSYTKKNYGALLFIDLDHFKELNDTFGHDAGDQLLIQTSNRLKECTRQSDTVVRLGGDEFLILLENLGAHRMNAYELTDAIAHKILKFLCQPYALKHGEYRIGASIGCTIFGDDPQKDAPMLIKEADLAMYDAKEKGRNQICFHNQKTYL